MSLAKSRLALFGPPGAGKGTQARFLVKRLGFAHISTGRILRKAKRDASALGRTTSAFIDAGKLVPDEVMCRLVENAVAETGWDHFVLDGFPRTMVQAHWLTQCLSANDAALDALVLMTLSDDRIVARLSQRRVHRITGENFHLDAKPPVGISPDLVVQRDDDRPAAIRERLRIYHETTRAVVGYYMRTGIVHEIDARGTFEQVHVRIRQLVHAG